MSSGRRGGSQFSAAGPHGPQRMVLLDAVLDRALRSTRLRRQIEQGRSLAAEVDRLRQRVEVMEQLRGLR